MGLYGNSTQPVHIHFTENASPVDPRLVLLGELRDASGKRVWTGYGRHQAEILAHAASWLDDCHGLTWWVCDTLYPYMDDTHLDTALRKITADATLKGE